MLVLNYLLELNLKIIKNMNYIKHILTNKNTLVFIGVILFAFLFLKQCNNTSNLKKELEQIKMVSERALNNYKASQDTIKIEKNKNGELVAIKLGYEYEINSLTKENKKVIAKYQSALNLVKDVSRINSLLSAELRVKDSIINAGGSVTTLTDSTSTIKFNDIKKWDKYNWRSFNGTVDVLRDSKTNKLSVTSSRFDFEQGIELKAAILNNNGINSLRITTAYPGIEFTNIENINLVNDKLNPALQKPKNWGIGVGLQYGINLNDQQTINWGPSIGVGIYYIPSWLRF
jgi:hypothetical protein